VTIVNRRNAVIGWAAWKVGKRAMKRKAQSAKPSVEDGRPNKPMVAAATAAGAAAATAGAVAVWRKRHGGDEDES
jgi:hypothetical protein